jgi:hypothetical protein
MIALEPFWRTSHEVKRDRVAPDSWPFACGVPGSAHAQSRGVYPLGMTAVGSGVTPDPGFTYANQLLFYSRDESKADDGSTLPVSGQNAVIMDMNSFVWVSRWTFLGGAHYSAVATLPVAKNQLVSDIHGQLSGGGGSLIRTICRSSSAGTRNAPRSAPRRLPRPDWALHRRRQRQRGIGVLDTDPVVGADRAAHPR